MAIKILLSRNYAAFFIALLAVLFSISINARQLGDVSLPDSVVVDGTDTALPLNGMGYRSKFIFKVYVGALYTQSKVKSRDAVQALTGPKRIVMHMVYDEVSSKKMAAAFNEGFEENTTDEQLEKLKARIQTLISYFPDLKKGNSVLLDYVPQAGTRVTINGEEKAVITGADFYSALLDIWLGEEPADEELKEAMLGEDEDD